MNRVLLVYDEGSERWRMPEYRPATPAEIAEAAGVAELRAQCDALRTEVLELQGRLLAAEEIIPKEFWHKLATVTKQRDGLLEAADALMSALMNKGVAAQKYAVDLRAAIADCKSKEAAE